MQPKVDPLTKDFFLSSPYVLLEFSAPWCGLCRMVQPILNRMVAEWGDTLLLIGINVDQNLVLAHRYRIRSLPTLLLLREGEEVERLSHFSSREEVIRSCEQLMHRYAEQELQVS